MKPKPKGKKKRASERNRQKALTKKIRRLLEERGMSTLEKVEEAIHEEKIESQEIREAIKHFLSYRHGFLVRPMLISLGCEIVGGKTDLIADVATPLVLMSGGMDIHDDIIDNQKTQESRPTVFGKFKGDIALLAGDALLFKGLIAWHKLADRKLPIEKFMKMTQILDKAFFEVGDGEALELNFEDRLDVDPEQYLNMVRMKAADIGMLLCLGAILGNGSQPQIEALDHYGRNLGMLWVLSDDVADIFDVTEMNRRISKGCLPLPLFYASKNPEAELLIKKILTAKKMTNHDQQDLLQATIDAGGLEPLRKIMKMLSEKALEEIAMFKNGAKLKLLIEASLNFISQV